MSHTFVLSDIFFRYDEHGYYTVVSFKSIPYNDLLLYIVINTKSTENSPKQMHYLLLTALLLQCPAF